MQAAASRTRHAHGSRHAQGSRHAHGSRQEKTGEGGHSGQQRRAFKELIAASRASRGLATPRRTLAEVEETFLSRGARAGKGKRTHGRSADSGHIFAKTTAFKDHGDLEASAWRERAYGVSGYLKGSIGSEAKVAAGTPDGREELAQLLSRWQALRADFFAARKRRRNASHRALRDEYSLWLRSRNPVLNAQWAALQERRMDLLQWFRVLDLDGSGEISSSELVDPLLTVGLCRSRREVDELVAAIDVDGSGAIGFDEFVSIVCSEDGDGPHEGNALVQLYKAAARGELGNPELNFPTLLASYRRKVILRALAPVSNRMELSEGRKKDKLCVNALANEYWTQKYS